MKKSIDPGVSTVPTLSTYIAGKLLMKRKNYLFVFRTIELNLSWICSVFVYFSDPV